jgi:hypothetical protein
MTALAVSTGAALYLDLLKRTLTGMVYEDPPVPVPWDPRHDFDEARRRVGVDWPSRAHTMIGVRRLDNIQYCAEQVLADDIPGDFLEAGVWRGGACIFMRAVLEAHGVRDRAVWVADSFLGLPQNEVRQDDRRFANDVQPDQAYLAVSRQQVEHNFSLYGLLDDQVRFLEGWFSDTLPAAPVKRLAVLRMDGDLYSSITDTLVNLYPKLEPGGFCLIDDYHSIPNCTAAVNDYRAAEGIREPICEVEGYGVFWRREMP